jgi:class 3 adenylate cyclase
MNTRVPKRLAFPNLFNLINYMTIRSKLQTFLVLTSLISILLTGAISYITARQALNKSIYDGLTALRVRQAGEVEGFFARMGDEVLSLSESPIIIEAFNDLRNAYKELDKQPLPPAQNQKLKDFYKTEVIPKISPEGGTAAEAAIENYLPIDSASRYLQSYYIAGNPNPIVHKEKLKKANDGSAYSQVHEKWHPRFQRLTDLFGYYDIMMIDGESGRVIYNVSKELDFAADLKNGVFADSNVAEAFKRVLKSRDPNFVTITDFENYRPSYNSPSAFIATTIHENGKFVGSLVFQIPADRLKDVMTVGGKWRDVGLGNTGESILVGEDFKTRSEPRKFLENPDEYFETLRAKGISQQEIEQMWKLKTAVLGQELKTPSSEKALSGLSGTEILPDYRGVDNLISYQPVILGKNVDKPLKWSLITKKEAAEAFAPIRGLAQRLLITGAILLPLVALFSNWIANLFTRPIDRLVEGTRRISAGETDIQVNVAVKDEFGELADSFNDMARTLHHKELTIQQQLEENERLLLNVLPPSAVKRVQEGERDFADTYSNISLMYAEIEGFSDLIEQVNPEDSVLLLNELIGAFDEAAESFGVEKLKTVGTAYLAVSGLSVPRVDHAKRIVDFAVDMIRIIQRFNQAHNSNLSLDIGVHSGPVVGGIVGKSKFIYEVWGDSLKIAYAIHSSSEDNIIQVTAPIRDALENIYSFKEMGAAKVKGMEDIAVWQVDYAKTGTKALVNGGTKI